MQKEIQSAIDYITHERPPYVQLPYGPGCLNGRFGEQRTFLLNADNIPKLNAPERFMLDKIDSFLMKHDQVHVLGLGESLGLSFQIVAERKHHEIWDKRLILVAINKPGHSLDLLYKEAKRRLDLSWAHELFIRLEVSDEMSTLRRQECINKSAPLATPEELAYLEARLSAGLVHYETVDPLDLPQLALSKGYGPFHMGHEFLGSVHHNEQRNSAVEAVAALLAPDGILMTANAEPTIYAYDQILNRMGYTWAFLDDPYFAAYKRYRVYEKILTPDYATQYNPKDV